MRFDRARGAGCYHAAPPVRGARAACYAPAGPSAGPAMKAEPLQPKFCDLCSESIPDADFASGEAVRKGDRSICSGCRWQLEQARERARSAHEAARSESSHGGAQAGEPSAAHPVVVRPRERQPLALAAFLIAVLAVLGAATVAWLGQRELRGLSARVAGIDPAQAERVQKLERQLSDVEGRLARWFDEQWERHAAGLAPTKLNELESTSTLPQVDLAPLEAALDELAQSDAQFRTTLEQRLAALESQLRAAQVLASAAAPELGPLADMAPERRTRLDQLRSSEPTRRARALLELSAAPHADDAPFTAGLLRDPDPFVRAAAARHLELVSARPAVGALIETLSDPEPTVRAAADSALRSITRQSFLFDPWANDSTRSLGLAEWRAWWSSSWREFLFHSPQGR